MADIKGIEIESMVYGLEDKEARDDVETNTSAIGTLANLQTTAKTNLVAAINELALGINYQRVAKTVSFLNDFVEATGSVVHYVPGIEALVFYVGGSRAEPISENTPLFSFTLSEHFSMGGYGRYVQCTLRNSATGALGEGIVEIMKSGQTVTATLRAVLSSGNFSEFRLLGLSLISL